MDAKINDKLEECPPVKESKKDARLYTMIYYDL